MHFEVAIAPPNLCEVLQFWTSLKSGVSFSELNLHYGDLTDTTSLVSILTATRPDEIYNLAAQSHVQVRILFLQSANATSIEVIRDQHGYCRLKLMGGLFASRTRNIMSRTRSTAFLI